MLVAFLNLFITYNIAFKLITILGSLLLIPSLYTLGRKFNLPRPVPLALALSGVGYLFGTSYTIDGGNLASTLAGEYSFSLSLALGIYVVAIAAKRDMNNKDMAVGALLFGLATLAHILPSFWVGAALVFLVLLKRVYFRTWNDLPRTAGIVILAAFITAFWALPFAWRISYSTSMGWSKVTTYGATLFPHSLEPWTIMAACGLIVSLARKQVLGVLLGILGVISIAAFIFLPNSAVYNARALPFWVLSLYALSGIFLGNAGILIAGAYSALAAMVRHDRAAVALDNTAPDYLSEVDAAYAHPSSLIGLELSTKEVAEVLDQDERIRRSRRWTAWRIGEANLAPKSHFATGAVVSAIVFVISGLGLFAPISWLPIHATPSFVPSWLKWNYTGYEAKPGYAEYRRIMVTMQNVGKKYGCGPAMWEYNSQENSYGTPMALMLLPYWTNSCIGSMEGLFFESSATTPFHFLNQSELSAFPSDAMAGLPYTGVNVPLGIQHLQLLGVRYYMAFSPNVVAQANKDPELQKVATVPAVAPSSGQASALGWTWSIYRVRSAQRVVPLSNLPVVLDGIKPNQASWVNTVVKWYDNPKLWSVFPAQSGPSNWPRVAKTSGHFPAVATSTVKVTNISETNASVAFDVSKPGTPVLVKTSYFPNWTARGAKGPYRVAPNLMVVVPTSSHVVVYYGMTPIDYIGYAVTILSLGVTVFMIAGYQFKRSRKSVD